MGDKIVTISKIVFALIFVLILATIMGTITNKGNSANEKLIDTLEITDNSTLEAYTTGTKVKGEAVINAIRNVKSIGGGLNLYVEVTTGADKTTTYGYTSGASTPKGYAVTDTSADDYINPSAFFTTTQVTNDNGIIVGLKFVQD